ncbi:hypothetical protein [uncultured Photobacterium sp.]|uniref:hypothetical protein n=1 Tax=uncultured Photobacterium sp. TaxID=173973 RepID=UPI0026315645|nr:hypothetical protein [uncultured Photobacterium sp.]
MWLEAFNRQQKKRFRYLIWLSVVFLVLTVMLVQWRQIDAKAEQTQLKVLEQNFHKSASSLRQMWELQDKPEQLEVDGIKFALTSLGWPIVLRDGQVDCQQMWDLLVSREGSVDYLRFYSKKEVRSGQYNSCFYQITGGNWLELFYQRERIRINGFLTD